MPILLIRHAFLVAQILGMLLIRQGPVYSLALEIILQIIQLIDVYKLALQHLIITP
jgi:hypothetical protein